MSKKILYITVAVLFVNTAIANKLTIQPPPVFKATPQYKTCKKTEYNGNLYWDKKKKVYWSQQGRFAVALNTCAINACHYLTLATGKKTHISCLARPDNKHNCQVPCYEEKDYPN